MLEENIMETRSLHDGVEEVSEREGDGFLKVFLCPYGGAACLLLLMLSQALLLLRFLLSRTSGCCCAG